MPLKEPKRTNEKVYHSRQKAYFQIFSISFYHISSQNSMETISFFVQNSIKLFGTFRKAIFSCHISAKDWLLKKNPSTVRMLFSP